MRLSVHPVRSVWKLVEPSSMVGIFPLAHLTDNPFSHREVRQFHWIFESRCIIADKKQRWWQRVLTVIHRDFPVQLHSKTRAWIFPKCVKVRGYWHTLEVRICCDTKLIRQEIHVIRLYTRKPRCQRFSHYYSIPMQTPCPSVLWHCWLGDRKGIRPVKSWVLVCWWWRFDWSFACITASVVTTTSIILSSYNSRMGTFWYQLTQAYLENGH